MDRLKSYFVVAIHEYALPAFHVGDQIPGFPAGKCLRNLRDLNHAAWYFGTELFVAMDPAFHAGEDIQGEPEGEQR